MSRLKALIHEIHRRSLWQVLLVYVAGSWAVLAAVDTLAGALGLPGWAPRLALFLLIVGLPMVLATAFMQGGVGPGSPEEGAEAGETEGSGRVTRPGGTAEAKPGPSSARAEAGADAETAPNTDTKAALVGRLFTWRNVLRGATAALALWGLVSAGWLLLDGGRGAPAAAAADGRGEELSVAVLPFENRSAAEEDAAFFAEGLHDEILTLLSKVGLRVTSRTSVMEYREGSRNIGEIADALGVDYVVEGGVQRAGQQVRISIQLIDGKTDEHRWAHTYTDSFTVANIFAIQADIARQIAHALETELTPGEYEAYLTPSTDSEDAYESFLRGIAALGRDRFMASDMEEAHEHLERALELDPGFAPARVALAATRIHLSNYGGGDRTGDLLAEAKRMLDGVLARHPNLPAAHYALGLYHYHLGDYARALEAWERHQQLEPGNANLEGQLANVYRRQGRWEEALTHRLRGLDANPRNSGGYVNLALTYDFLRRHDEARAAARRALELDPASPFALVFAARAALEVEGPAAARSALREAPAEIANHSSIVQLLTWLDQWEGDHRSALRRTELVEDVVRSGDYLLVPGLWRARSLMALGDTAAARAELTGVAERLESLLEEDSDDHAALGAIGTVFAALGRKEEAIAAAERAVELVPVEKDAMIGPIRLQGLALVYTWTGHADEAVELLERLLSIPGQLTRTWLANDPRWDPLRGHAGFEELLE